MCKLASSPNLLFSSCSQPQYGQGARSVREVWRHVTCEKQSKLHPKLEVTSTMVNASQDALVEFTFVNDTAHKVVTTNKTANDVWEKLEELNFIIQSELEDEGKI